MSLTALKSRHWTSVTVQLCHVPVATFWWRGKRWQWARSGQSSCEKYFEMSKKVAFWTIVALLICHTLAEGASRKAILALALWRTAHIWTGARLTVCDRLKEKVNKKDSFDLYLAGWLADTRTATEFLVIRTNGCKNRMNGSKCTFLGLVHLSPRDISPREYILQSVHAQSPLCRSNQSSTASCK